MRQPQTLIGAFVLGALQFRSDWTTHFNDCAMAAAYDFGRELAHRLTFRRFDRR